MEDLFQALDAEVGRFRAWADANLPISDRRGDWEGAYPHWGDLCESFCAVVQSTACDNWSEATIDSLLYAIARDNEGELYADIVSMYPDKLLSLAEHAQDSPEWEARWQLAKQLGMMEPRSPEAEPLLLRFERDEDEYVRRMALLALARIGSSRTEELAGLAWDDGYEYQRIAALCALDMVESPLLAGYAARPGADSGEVLPMYAAVIREKGTLRGFSIHGIPVIP